MKCKYEHHKKTFGKELGKCEKHPEEDIQCGAFEHGCVKCAGKCRICGKSRVHCCC